MGNYIILSLVKIGFSTGSVIAGIIKSSYEERDIKRS